MQDAADHSRDCESATVQHHARRTAAHQLMKSHFSQKLASSTGRPVVVVAHKEAMPGEEAEPRSKSLGRLVMRSHCVQVQGSRFLCMQSQAKLQRSFSMAPQKFTGAVHVWDCACLTPA